MNYFVALRPDDATCDRLSDISERLQRWGLPATWTAPHDLHATVCFLGPVAANDALWLPTIVASVAEAVRLPRLRIVGLGASGERNGGCGQVMPRAVFAALADVEELCNGLHADVCDVVEVTPDPRFRPHVTLCRPRARGPGDGPQSSPGGWPELLEAHGLAEWGEARFERLGLYRSESDQRGGRRYQELASWPLLPA